MGSRRRTYIVLAVVAILIALSALAIVNKPTRLGLDLQGGTCLLYTSDAADE